MNRNLQLKNSDQKNVNHTRGSNFGLKKWVKLLVGIVFGTLACAVVADDHGDTPLDATLIVVDSATAGTIDSADDVDVFRINLDKFGELKAWTTSKLWMEGKLLDDRGIVRAIDNFRGPGLNFQIEEDVAPGVWYVEVRGYWNDDVGDYTLHVEFEENDEVLPAAWPRTAHLGDFNGDKYQDILLRHLDGRWYYFAMNGREVIENESGFVALTRDHSYSVAGVGDFNGDGKDDLLLRHINGNWQYHLMNGRTRLGESQQFSQIPTDINYQIVGIGNFSYFGETDDVLLRNRLDGTWILVEMRGTDEPWIDDFSINRRLTQSLDYRVAGVGDFDANGQHDVLLRHKDDGSWYLYLLDRFNNIASEGSVSFEEDLSYRIAGISDFNGDGNDDVLLRHDNGHWLFYPMVDGSPDSANVGSADITESAELSIVAVGDLNGDAKSDVVLRDSNGAWHYFAMNGSMSINEESGILPITKDLSWAVPRLSIRATIGGSLNVTDGQILDGDTGDALDPHEPNDSVEQSQNIRIPSSIAGYMIAGIDDSDYYDVRFPTRQAVTRISLVIADSDDSDFDLHLADSSGSIVSESMGLENLEVIETNRQGDHIIVVTAQNGSSNYTLSISSQLIDSQEKEDSYSVSRDGDFVLDELIVNLYEPRKDIDHVMETNGFRLRHSYLTGLGDSLIRIGDPSNPKSHALNHPTLTDLKYASSDLAARGLLLRLRKQLLISGDFEYVELNYIYRSDIEPNDPHYQFQWHYPQINLPLAWDYTTGDDDVIVAVIDSGILRNIRISRDSYSTTTERSLAMTL